MKIKISNSGDYECLRKRVGDIFYIDYAKKLDIEIVSFQTYKIKLKSFSVEFVARYDLKHKPRIKDFSYYVKIVAHFAVKDDIDSVYKLELLELSNRNNDDDIKLQDKLANEELYFEVPDYYIY